ncbi:MAG TPA: GAF domain-containing sensor histidine kinase [Anaerolineae bacterium]|nr:GAF domain-containing sensor histidine kinase [Anaerolineae bacterium]
MHDKLRQQLDHHNLNIDDLPPAWQNFLQTVDDTYAHYHQQLTVEKQIGERIQQDMSRQKRLFENLVIVAQSTTGHATLEETLQSILDVTIMLTGTNERGRSSLFIYDANGEITTVILAREQVINYQLTEKSRRFASQGLTGWVARNRRAALLQDTSQDERWLASPEDIHTARSALSVPILSGFRLLGVLTLTNPDLNYFGDEDLSFLEVASTQLALALRNAELHNEQIRQAEHQATLYRTLRTVVIAEFDATIIAHEAVKALADLTPWPMINILFPNEEQTILQLEATAGPVIPPENWQIPIQQGISGRAYRTKQTQYVPLTAEDDDYVAIHDIVRSELAVPMIRGDHVLGILNIESNQAKAFKPDDIRLAESLAEAISLALDNAQLHGALINAKEEAERANRAKSEFVSVASHELKNPMTSIAGYSDLLMTGVVGPLNEQQTNFLKTIRANVARMQTIVSDLTDVSQIESGKFHLDCADVPIIEVIDEVVRSLQHQIETKKQHLELALPENLPTVWADRTRLSQIMVNLLSNAYKYTPEGGTITIHINDHQETNPHTGELQEMVHIAVADTGLGITPEDQQKLFQKFFRASDEQARKSPGTGLGLNITKNLVELQGGDIWFESEYRQGTTFHITVPKHPAH